MKTRTKKPSTPRSLSATLALGFLGLSVIVLLISGGLQAYSNLATQQEAVTDKLQLIAQEASQPVSSFIQEKFSILETAARLNNPMTMTQDKQQQMLGGLLGRDPAFRQVIVLNLQDQEIARASRLSQQAAGTLANQLSGEMLDQVRHGQQAISAVRVDPDTSEPLVVLATPVIDAVGDFQGTLAAEVNLKFMWDLVDQLQVGETGAAYVVDKQGDLLAFNDTARVLRGENVANLPKVREFITGIGEVPFLDLTTGIQGVPIVGGFAPLGTPDWAVITEMPWNEAYRGAIQNVLAAVVILIIMAAVAGLLGIYLARRLAVPLVNLTDTASRISAGEMELQATTAGPREVGALAQAFNSMTTRLRDLIDTLEVRVEMRTAQVQASADVGRVVTSILDPEQLLLQVVQLITERFGFYYAAVFTLDPTEQWAVLREASGPSNAAWLLKQAGHRLEITGNSMVAACIRDRHARIALDTGAEAVRFANPLLPDTHSEVALPLAVGDQILGVLDVQSTQVAAFDETSTAVLQNMADQIAIALNNAGQYRAEQAHAQQTTYLLEATVELTSQSDVAGLYKRIIELTETLLHVDCAALWLPISETELELRTASGPLQGMIGQRLAIGEGMAGRVYATGLALRLTDIRTWKDSVLDYGEAPVRAALATPMIWQGQPIGVLVAAHTQLERSFSADDGNAAQLFAAQAASAAENVQLLARLQNTLNELAQANKRLTGEAWQQHLRDREIIYQHQPGALGESTRPALSLSVPIELRGHAIGQVTVEDDEPQRQLSTDEQALVQEVVQRMALALDSARLFEQTQSALGEARRLAQRERLINRITSQLRGAVTVDEVLRIAADEMRHSVGAAYTAVKLTPPTQNNGEQGEDHEGA